MTETTAFRKCSTCKTPIAYGSKYFKCSVSTCNRRPTALYFCSVPCWDAHVPDARHRDAWAEEETAPSGPEADDAEEKPLRRKVVTTSPSTPAGAGAPEPLSDDLPRDVLVVMSKVKAFVKAHSELRTSDGVSDPLSDHLRSVCAKAARSAQANGRTTLLARDVEAALRGETASD
jgi:hypothetical protein